MLSCQAIRHGMLERYRQNRPHLGGLHRPALSHGVIWPNLALCEPRPSGLMHARNWVRPHQGHDLSPTIANKGSATRYDHVCFLRSGDLFHRRFSRRLYELCRGFQVILATRTFGVGLSRIEAYAGAVAAPGAGTPPGYVYKRGARCCDKEKAGGEVSA